MNCPKCNTPNNSNGRFCGSCGYDFQQVTQQSTPKDEQEEILEVEETVALPHEAEPVMQPMPQITAEQNSMYSAPKTMPEPPVINQPIINNGVNQSNLNPEPHLKKNKTGLIIIGGIIAIAIIVVCVVLIIGMISSEKREEKAKINAIFNPNQLIKVKKDDKYGYINTDGEFKIQPIYEYATEFVEKYAVVRAEVKDEDLTKTVYQIIDEKGKVKKQADKSIEYIEEASSWVIDDELYNNKMKKISPENVKVKHEEDKYFIWVNSKENTGGIMNEKGKQVFTYKFQSGENSIYLDVPSIDKTQTERYCIVNVQNKYGIVNCDTGTEIRPLAADVISGGENIFKIRDSKYKLKELLYVQNDKIMYKTESEDIDLYYYPGYVAIRDGSKPYDERYKYLHTETGKIEDEQPKAKDNNIEESTEPWEKETKNKKFSCSAGYGLMNNDQITLPCEWERLEYLDVNLYKYLKENKKNYIYGEKDDKSYLIDLNTKKATVEFNTSYITTKENTTFIYYTDNVTETKKVYNLLTGKSLSIDGNKSLSIYSNYITVNDRSAGELKYYNTDLIMIYKEI